MASPRLARIASSKQLNGETRLLEFVMPEGEPLNFAGGQYVIINTNIPLPGGKIAKRAYSILSSDREQSKFEIAVKKVGTGPGSNYMHVTQNGAEVPFSGPWGQFVPDEPGTSGRTLVLATDTGITAALGLIQGAKFKSCADQARMIWFVESENYFIPPSFVRDICSSVDLDFSIEALPSVNHPERLSRALAVLARLIQEVRPASVFLSGDGNLLYPIKEQLMASQIEEKQIKIECFFNNPFKKIGGTR